MTRDTPRARPFDPARLSIVGQCLRRTFGVPADPDTNAFADLLRRLDATDPDRPPRRAG